MYFSKRSRFSIWISCHFLVAKATLELAGHGQRVSESVTLFNFVIMTSYQLSLEVYKVFFQTLKDQSHATTGRPGLGYLTLVFAGCGLQAGGLGVWGPRTPLPHVQAGGGLGQPRHGDCPRDSPTQPPLHRPQPLALVLAVLASPDSERGLRQDSDTLHPHKGGRSLDEAKCLSDGVENPSHFYIFILHVWLNCILFL